MKKFHLNEDIATSMGISRKTAQNFPLPTKKKIWMKDGSNPKDIRKIKMARGEKEKSQTPNHPERKPP
jgi:hypothetical protein